jgi:hypothetical protein
MFVVMVAIAAGFGQKSHILMKLVLISRDDRLVLRVDRKLAPSSMRHEG